MEFTIVGASTDGRMVDVVNAALANGWVPCGGLVSRPDGGLSLAMTRGNADTPIPDAAGDLTYDYERGEYLPQSQISAMRLSRSIKSTEFV